MNARLHSFAGLTTQAPAHLTRSFPAKGLGHSRLSFFRRPCVVSRSVEEESSNNIKEVRQWIDNWKAKNGLETTELNGSVGTAEEAKDDVQGEIVKPSPANSPVVGAVVIAAVILGAARSTAMFSAKGAVFAHIVAFGAWFGASIWVTLIAGITMFKNMPRQMFGRVQSKLFPQYFFLASTMTGVMLLTPLSAAKPLALIIALVCSLGNWLIVEPAATKVLFERYELENQTPRDAEQISKLYKEFSKFHGLSSMLNLGALCAGFGHAWSLAALVAI